MADVEAKKSKKTKGKEKKIAGALENISARGRTFKGIVTKILGNRAVIEFERTVKIHKYERFAKKKTKLHARIPANITIGQDDIVSVRECRPLSKIIHFVVIKKHEQISVGGKNEGN